MTDKHRVIYVAASVGQAYVLKNLLADNGIAAYVTNDTLNAVHFAAGDFLIRLAGAPGLYDTAPSVVVLEKDADNARRIALAADANLQAKTRSPELEELERAAGDDAEWPDCPYCRRPRLASCPVCETAGTHFDEAFLPEGAADGQPASEGDRREPLMVICPTCDEPFAPQFPPRCEWCGHRFAGLPEPPPAEAQAAPPAAWEFNGRVVMVVAGLVAATAALLGWFYYILHRTP